MEQEIWGPIPGFVGYYEASTLGRVRSVDRSYAIPATNRSKGYWRLRKGRVLKTTLSRANDTATGYQQVTLWKEHECTVGHVHQFVALTFIGPRPDGMYVCHADGDGQNNRLSNLYYGTPKQNSADAERHGTAAKGERHGAAKLTPDQVAEIRAARGKITQRELAEKFGVRQNTISKIQLGDRWKNEQSLGLN